MQAEYSRRYPDPLNSVEAEPKENIEHHVLLCRAASLPEDLPTDPDPRVPKVDRRIYKDVAESLCNESDPTFHLKNKGITIIAHAVNLRDKKNVEVFFEKGDGIVDGAHTYEIIRNNKEECPDSQFVRLEILTGIRGDLITSIAEGLNTAVQVQAMSLGNLAGQFNWIKELLADEPYARQIAYRENEDLPFDIRDIVALLTLFNVELFPDGSSHPKVAYTSKAKALELYKNNKKSYMKLRPLVKDILCLHDCIQKESSSLYTDKYRGRGGALAFVKRHKKPKTKPRRKYKLTFTGDEVEFKLYEGALYPILGAFRYLVEVKDGSPYFSWKPGSFKNVRKLFRQIGADLIYATKNTSDTHGKNPNAIGKDENHWDNLYNKVGMAYLEKTLKS